MINSIYVHTLNCLFFFAGLFYRTTLNFKAFITLYRNFGSQKVDKKIVIIGGGFAGSKIAQELEYYFSQVYLVDTKDYFEFTPSILRTLIEPSHINNIQIPHSKYLSSTKFIKAKLTNISENLLYFQPLDNDSPSSFTYDYLILCTGSSYSGALFHPPFKVELPKEESVDEIELKNQQRIEESFVFNTNRANEIVNCCKRIEEIEKILIIGGGTVAVELAGEILSKYEDKEITIVHSGEELLHRYPLSVSRHVRSFLSSYPKTRVITNDRVSSLPSSLQDGKGKIITEKGKEINTEIVFICTGIQPNSSFINTKQQNININLNSEIDQEIDQQLIIIDENNQFKDDKGFLKVNSFLQLEGKENIFVCGDVANTKEEKLAQSAQNAADIVISNLISSIKKRNLVEYKQNKILPIVISLGTIDAIFIWKNWVFTGFFPSLMKTFIEFKVLITYFPPIFSFFRRN